MSLIERKFKMQRLPFFLKAREEYDDIDKLDSKSYKELRDTMNLNADKFGIEDRVRFHINYDPTLYYGRVKGIDIADPHKSTDKFAVRDRLVTVKADSGETWQLFATFVERA